MFEVEKEAMVIDIHPELAQLQDHLIDQDEEQSGQNFIEEGEEAQHIFINARLSADLKQALLGLLREFKYVST